MDDLGRLRERFRHKGEMEDRGVEEAPWYLSSLTMIVVLLEREGLGPQKKMSRASCLTWNHKPADEIVDVN